jgi:hypothetical protein
MTGVDIDLSKTKISREDIENNTNQYNQFRPHSSLGYRPPTPETIKPKVEILT